MSETYLSIDIESDGPCPGLNSMLSLGAAAFVDGALHSTFSVNLDLLEGATPNPETMTWWATQPEAWRACRADTVPPLEAMRSFEAFVKALPGKVIAVAYPIGFDFLFVKYYFHRLLDRCPLGFQGIDIRSYAMGRLHVTYAATQKASLPQELFPQARHTHVAVDDAIEQGELFLNLGGRHTPSRETKTWEQMYADMDVDETNPLDVAVAEQVRRIYHLGRPTGSPGELEAFRRMRGAYSTLRSNCSQETLDALREALDALEVVMA